MTDERLKIWIDLGKWAVVSVGLVIMTTIINAGFKDREVGINEIKEYDKYVSLVTDNTKISERRLLAQYFAHITPSEKLKEGWALYFKTVDEEYNKLMEMREQKQMQLAELKKSSDSLTIPSPEIQKLEREIESIDHELTPTFRKETKANDYESALRWEEIGFENIINKNLDQAITAFENAELSYSSFHQVYEIARFLRSKRNSGEVQNDSFWQEVFQTLLSDYSWKMPEASRARLSELTQ
ncbi:hypothetical protein OKW21_003837 [Catalinimonas alkaloidigena]|uniref:hypothetical protein n=1 Tax=Catalinimonas alkaloidigena TaxID=1075417 RepID=UPI0024060FB1|nr:hypothetical protein [Catalinimonas alkaloidigena]MDF9798574.1 hypothetical protein [Catalinimonas alkaloidigena]